MKRLLAMLSLGALLAVPIPAQAEEIPTPGVHGSLSQAWGTAAYSAYRYGWGAHINTEVSDTARDHHAVYLAIELDVADGLDPNATALNNSGVGTTVPGRVHVSAGTGTAIRGVRLTLCKRIDNWPDTCVETWKALPPQPAQNADLRPAADALMTTSMTRFQEEKSRTPQPYDWTDDGCSNPALPEGLKDRPALLFSFKDACERHDFGYRNYGKYYGRQLSPTDATKAWIDAIFLRDMNAACTDSSSCLVWAAAYYNAVRFMAGEAFYAR